MSKSELKEFIYVLIFSIINTCIAYFITSALGIQNIILYKSLTAMEYIITYEVIIFFALSFIEAFIYEKKYQLI